MSDPKLQRMLQLLCALHQRPWSSAELSVALDCSVPTVKHLVYSLREVGCIIQHVGGSRASRYVLDGWGIFDQSAVLSRFGAADQSSGAAP